MSHYTMLFKYVFWHFHFYFNFSFLYFRGIYTTHPTHLLATYHLISNACSWNTTKCFKYLQNQHNLKLHFLSLFEVYFQRGII